MYIIYTEKYNMRLYFVSIDASTGLIEWSADIEESCLMNSCKLRDVCTNLDSLSYLYEIMHQE